MEKGKIAALVMVILAVGLLVFQFLTRDHGHSAPLLAFSVCMLITGTLLLLMKGGSGDYWRNVNPAQLEKVVKRVGREKDYVTLSNIGFLAKDEEVKQAAIRRLTMLLEEGLAASKNPEEAERIIGFIAEGSADHGEYYELLEIAAQAYPEVTRKKVERQVGICSNSCKNPARLAFLQEAAVLYPDILRTVWPKMLKAIHDDSNSHADKPSGFHTDSTRYYDYYKYPDGKVVPNRNGRRQHTDTRSSYSDCHGDAHEDNNTHTDKSNEHILHPLKAYISERDN